MSYATRVVTERLHGSCRAVKHVVGSDNGGRVHVRLEMSQTTKGGIGYGERVVLSDGATEGINHHTSRHLHHVCVVLPQSLLGLKYTTETVCNNNCSSNKSPLVIEVFGYSVWSGMGHIAAEELRVFLIIVIAALGRLITSICIVKIPHRGETAGIFG